MLSSNPCQVSAGGHVRHAERVPATPAQVATMAAAMPDRYRAAVAVAAWSGLRAGELFALRRGDVDLEHGSVRVDRAQVEVPGRPVTYGPPKGVMGARTVHLPKQVAVVLATHLAEFVPHRTDALVFATKGGAPVRSAQRSAMFARARKAAGRDDLRWHDLRHTGATLAAHTGASLAELQRRLGHSTARAALIYQHASDERDRELAARLNALTFSSSG
jgi:integrase